MTATQPTVRQREPRGRRASVPRLNPALPVLRCGDDTVQIGTDPRWAVRLAGLPQADVAACVDGRPPEGPLLTALHDAGLLLETAGTATAERELAVPPAERLVAELTDGSSVGCLARSQARVGVVGLGRLGLAIAGALAGAGIGELWLADEAMVTAADVAVAGYRLADTGQRRVTAAARVLRDASPRTTVVTRSDSSPDVVVVVANFAVDPGLVMRLMAEGQRHLVVVVTEASVTVGPTVIPGLTTCHRCCELHRTDIDPQWPAVAAELTARAAEAPPTAAVTMVAAGLACADVLAVVDGRRPQTADAAWELAVPSVAPRRREWSRHPACGCAGLADPAHRSGGALLRWASSPTLDRDDLAVDEDLATPHAPRLTPVDGAGEAAGAQRALLAQGFGELDVDGPLSEPELGIVVTARNERADDLVERVDWRRETRHSGDRGS